MYPMGRNFLTNSSSSCPILCPSGPEDVSQYCFSFYRKSLVTKSFNVSQEIYLILDSWFSHHCFSEEKKKKIKKTMGLWTIICMFLPGREIQELAGVCMVCFFGWSYYFAQIFSTGNILNPLKIFGTRNMPEGSQTSQQQKPPTAPDGNLIINVPEKFGKQTIIQTD